MPSRRASPAVVHCRIGCRPAARAAADVPSISAVPRRVVARPGRHEERVEDTVGAIIAAGCCWTDRGWMGHGTRMGRRVVGDKREGHARAT